MDEVDRPQGPRTRGGRRKGSGKRAAADAPWEFRAIQALADPSRWQMVRLLSIHEDSVSEMARRIGLSIACTSRHMSILIESEIVESRKSGRTTLCRLAAPGTRAAILLRSLGVDRLDGLTSGPVRPGSDAGSSIPEFETPRTAAKNRYQSKDIDDFLL